MWIREWNTTQEEMDACKQATKEGFNEKQITNMLFGLKKIHWKSITWTRLCIKYDTVEDLKEYKIDERCKTDLRKVLVNIYEDSKYITNNFIEKNYTNLLALVGKGDSNLLFKYLYKNITAKNIIELVDDEDFNETSIESKILTKKKEISNTPISETEEELMNVMYYLENKSINEIAKFLNRSTQSVTRYTAINEHKQRFEDAEKLESCAKALQLKLNKSNLNNNYSYKYIIEHIDELSNKVGYKIRGIVQVLLNRYNYTIPSKSHEVKND